MKTINFRLCSQKIAIKGSRLLAAALLVVGIFTGTARAQYSFAGAQVLSGDFGAVTNDNSLSIPDVGAPNIAGSAPRAPLWYQWTASHDGEVELDTISPPVMVPSLDMQFDTNSMQYVWVTNGFSEIPLDTVLGVYTGTDVRYLNQLAGNDDLYPVSSLSTTLISPLPEGTTNGSPGPLYIYQPEFTPVTYSYSSYYFGPGYYGPSHLRFNAKAGVTYYFAADSKSGSYTGPITLNWAYKASGVFRFASEDVDYTTGLPLYQAAETESYPPQGSGNVDAHSVSLTYYTYNPRGVLVTVTRAAGSKGRAMVDYQTIDGTDLNLSPLDGPAIAGQNYTAVSGTLVFDDFEMRKTILIPISSRGGVFGGLGQT
ncbi:MAG TPA: Calx-beta domain-containing protein, partial [Verrucomicrobiae bacterium]